MADGFQFGVFLSHNAEDKATIYPSPTEWLTRRRLSPSATDADFLQLASMQAQDPNSLLRIVAV